MAIKLVDDWKKAWKFASVQWAAVGLVLMTALEYANDLWIKLPADIQANVPYAGYIPAALFGLSIVGRLLVFTGKATDGDQQQN